ncbi:MAG: sigma-70 family RNA polymerase sigma factor [Eubacterium sp.]|nr:sigma-70 family RNA polymerase sigma factor [Eubacterium sp.]
MRENEFITIVKRNNQRLYLIALSYTKNGTDAEDIMQNVFMKLWKHSKPFEDDIHIDKWLTIVCINESRDYIKNPFRKRNVPIEEAIHISAVDKTGNIDLFKAVMSLPTKERTIIHLFYYEDMSINDISDILKMKESSVKTRLFRARQKLKTLLGDEWNNE